MSVNQEVKDHTENQTNIMEKGKEILKSINDLKMEAQKQIVTHPELKTDIKTKFENMMKQIESRAKMSNNLVKGM